jgi:hypothetical protein
MSAAAESARAGQRKACGVDTKGAVSLDNLALDAIAFPAVPGAASIAADGPLGYTGHVAILSAGFALQRSPAFSLPGAGSIG